MLTKEEKNVIVQKYGKDVKDTGNTQVQVAILTKRISELTAHLKKNKGDAVAKRSLSELVGKRRSLLAYLEKNDHEAYASLIESLKLRK
jgi:small subunit ribosomal protein S15